MSYYTNVLAWGNKVFVRGVENGQKFQEEIKDFKPPIWVPAKSPDSPSKFHTLSGYPVIQFEEIGRAHV